MADQNGTANWHIPPPARNAKTGSFSVYEPVVEHANDDDGGPDPDIDD